MLFFSSCGFFPLVFSFPLVYSFPPMYSSSFVSFSGPASSSFEGNPILFHKRLIVLWAPSVRNIKVRFVTVINICEMKYHVMNPPSVSALLFYQISGGVVKHGIERKRCCWKSNWSVRGVATKGLFQKMSTKGVASNKDCLGMNFPMKDCWEKENLKESFFQENIPDTEFWWKKIFIKSIFLKKDFLKKVFS